jgi:hypothetical protein
MHITLVGRDLVDFELYYGLYYILGFRYTISESATPGKRQAAPHGARRIREKGRWPLPMVDSGEPFQVSCQSATQIRGSR